MSEDDVIKLLAKACTAVGSQHQWAMKHRLSPQYVCDVLRKRRTPGPAMLAALDIEKVISYRKVKP